MTTNNILPFCPTDSGTNLLTQSAYAAATDRTVGNQPGVASSKLNNKALRQASFVASQFAQFMCDQTGIDVLDDGVTATLLAQIKATFAPYLPIVQKFTSSSGTYNKSYVFTITSGSATAGATYTNNSVTFTVVETVASGVRVTMTGSGAPSVSGTLTKASGTGDATLTFQAFKAPFYIRVCMVGGGGGGAGSSNTASNDGGNGGAGGNTTFGTTLLVANGGNGGKGGINPVQVGGTASLGTGPIGTAIQGASGGPGMGASSLLGFSPGYGGASPFGGAGSGATGSAATAGIAAIANSGSGGGGACATTGGGGGFAGGGGAAGGFVDAIITSPSASYAYAVGAAGTAGAAGTGGAAGGAGGSGYIEVTEYFQ